MLHLLFHREIYNSVCGYLQLVGRDAPRLFAPFIVLEDHVHDIISQLCKIPSARDEFQLGDGVWFDNHANALDEIEGSESEVNLPSNSQPSRPDQFCIH